MSKQLSGVMIAVLAAAVHFTAPALADHRPGNVVKQVFRPDFEAGSDGAAIPNEGTDWAAQVF